MQSTAMPIKAFDAEPFLSKIKRKRTAHYKTGEIIFRQGADADFVCFLQRGIVKQTVISEGRETIVEIVQPGDFFGASDFDGGHIRVCGAFAMRPSTVVLVINDDLQRAIDGDNGFARLFMAHLLDRERRAQEDKAMSIFGTTEKRLAHKLIELAYPTGIISKEINQGVLASMIGATRSSVSIFMNRFRKAGLIKYNGETQVDSRALHAAILEEKP